MTKLEKPLWVPVRHSAYGYKQDPRFSAGLQQEQITTVGERKLVLSVGGICFGNYLASDDFIMWAMYNDVQGLIPHCRGSFSNKKLDDLDIYVPTLEESKKAAEFAVKHDSALL